MPIRQFLVVSLTAAVALVASAALPLPSVGVLAQAPVTDGKGAAGANRALRSERVNPPTRPNAPTVNSTTVPKSVIGQRRSNQEQNTRRNRDAVPNRVIVKDRDRDQGSDRRRGTRYVWGPGLAFYFYDGFYHGDCSWLRRKARETGSSYWHKRYAQCRDE